MLRAAIVFAREAISRRELAIARATRHQAHHDRRITIRGTAENLEVTRAHVGVRHEVTTALVQLGWKPAIVRAALADLDVDAPLEQVLRAALQRCAALTG